MDDFEERLRHALQARAAGVRPDPARRAELARRIRRRRVVTYAVPATAAVAAVIVAAVVVPSLIPTATEVDLDDAAPGPDVADEAPEPEEPGDVADPGEPTDEPVAEPDELPDPEHLEAPDETDPDDPLAPLDEIEGLRARLAGLSILEEDTHHLVAEGATSEQVADATLAGPVAVSPRSSPAAPVVAFLRVPSDGDAEGCDAQLHVTGAVEPDAGPESRESVVVQAASCPGSPVISPSGRRVAWIEGGERMMAVDIAEALANEGMADTASWALEAAGSLDFRAWLSSTDGWRLVVAEATGGADQLHLMEIERQADGELALPAGGDVVDDRTAVSRERLSPVAVGVIEPRQPQASEVDLLGVDEANIAFLRRGELADGGRLEVVLGQDVGAALFDEEALEPVTTAWVTGHGRDALVGDGQGTVWHVLLPGRADEEPVVTELDADWTGAAFLPGQADDPGSPDADPDAGDSTS